MLKKLLIGALTLTLLTSLISIAADETPWYDFENCAMCKNLTLVPDFMKNLHHELVKVDRGFLMVTTADPGFVKQYKEASAKMNAVGEKLMAGEQLPMCGCCNAFGALLMKGAKMEARELKNGDVMLVTSDDPALVQELHAYVDKDMAEMAKLGAAMPKKDTK